MKTDEYNRRSRELHAELESLKLQRNNTREQMVWASFPLICFFSLTDP